MMFGLVGGGRDNQILEGRESFEVDFLASEAQKITWQFFEALGFGFVDCQGVMAGLCEV